MTRTALVLAPFVALAILSRAHAEPVPDYGFDWVTIGDVGNSGYDGPDEYNARITGRGSVGYEYRISRLEITTGQWLEFVNTFSTQSDDLSSFGSKPTWGALPDVRYSGPGTRWKLVDDPDAAMWPVVGIEWYDAARYANWLHNGKSSDLSAIETGAYDASTWGFDANGDATDDPHRMPGARFWIPSLDEWLKAAHYDPNKHGPGEPGWWRYGHASDVPTVPGYPREGESAAGLDFFDRPFPVQIPLGSYADVQSPWGLLDVSGGSDEWVEDYFYVDSGPFPPPPPTDRLFVGAQAGSGDLWWWYERADLTSSSRPQFGSAGLRIAGAVPPPACVQVLALAWMGSVRRRRSAS